MKHGIKCLKVTPDVAPYHVFRDTWTLSDIPTARLLDVPGVMIDLSWKIMKSGKELKDYAVVKEDILA